MPYFRLCQRINPRPNQIPHHQEGPGASGLHEERAAIMEYDDGLPRSEADQLAKQLVGDAAHEILKQHLSGKHHMSTRIGVRLGYGDSHVTAKVIQKPHQAICRKTIESAIDNGGNLRLIEAK